MVSIIYYNNARLGMKNMVYTNEYFNSKILELRLALRNLKGFTPVKGISEKIIVPAKNISNKIERVNVK